MRFAYREFLTPAMLVLVLSISSSLIILYTFIGPLDTRNALNWNVRLAFSVAIGALCLLICYPAMALTLFLARFQSNAKVMLALMVYCLVMAVPCGAIAYGVYGLFLGAPRPGGELPENYLICAANLLGATALTYYVLHLRVSRSQLLAGAPGTGRAAAPGAGTECRDDARGGTAPAAAAPPPHETFRVRGVDGEPPAGAPAGRATPVAPDAGADTPAGRAADDRPADPPSASFLDRLPAELGRDVVYLKVSGHYLEVVTTRGSSVILQRLRDAVRELGGRGMQIHRSYWVAHRHVRYVVRRDRRTLLHLTGDHEVPVSRTFLPEVRLRIKSAQRQRPSRRRAVRPPDRPAG